jgi:DNA polymerase III delta subunit
MNNGEFKNVYLFYGREFYLLENVIKTCRKSLNESMIDFNMDILDGKEITLDQVISNTETLPFMDERKIIVIKDFELLKGKKKNFTDNDENEFIDYLDKVPSSTVLVFIVYGDVDKRKSLVKKISKVGIVNHCDKLNDMDLFKWVKNRFKQKEVNINDSEIAYFIEQEGYREKNSEKTLSDLENEINKISSFVGKGNIVSKEIIDKLSPKKLENDIFKLIDEIGNKINLQYDDPFYLRSGDSYDPYENYYNDCEYAIAQHDFDADGMDEIVIAARIKNSNFDSPVGVFVYRIKDGKSWSFETRSILGDGEVELNNNYIKVDVHLRGFYHKWTYENGSFVDQSYY